MIALTILMNEFLIKVQNFGEENSGNEIVFQSFLIVSRFFLGDILKNDRDTIRNDRKTISNPDFSSILEMKSRLTTDSLVHSFGGRFQQGHMPDTPPVKRLAFAVFLEATSNTSIRR